MAALGASVLMESVLPLTHLGFTAIDRPTGDTVIELIFNVKPGNEAKLLSALLAVSDPSSPQYGQHLSKKEVDELTANAEGQRETTLFLNSVPGIKTSTGIDPSHIIASAPVASWEAALKTTFFNFEKLNSSGVKTSLIRAHEYSLPEHVAPHIVAVFNTVQFPAEIHHGPSILHPISMDAI
jgi:tripeptidyl-peptidase I